MTIPLRTISPSELQVILKDHRLWVSSGRTQGKRADLSGADLSGADLSGANLDNAKLYNAKLSGANLHGANLRDANLSGAYLSGANLTYANLFRANFRGADLRGANLEGVKDLPDFQRCPKEGLFKAFKKVCISSKHYVLELEVSADAKRVSSTGIKCRCSKAKVLRAMNLDGTAVEGADGMVFQSFHARANEFSFPYVVGQDVSVEDFDGDIRQECAPGIHFFMEFEEAAEYRY